MSEFEKFVRSQGFNGDFVRGDNGQFKSDTMHFLELAWNHQQKKIDEAIKAINKAPNELTYSDAMKALLILKGKEYKPEQLGWCKL